MERSHPYHHHWWIGLGCALLQIQDVLLEFWQAVDDAKPQVIPKLDLHHLGGEVVPDLLNFLGAELQLPPATFDQVVGTDLFTK